MLDFMLPKETRDYINKIEISGESNLTFEKNFKENEISKGAFEKAYFSYLNVPNFLGYVFCENLDKENLIYCNLYNKKCCNMINKIKKSIYDEMEIICSDYKRIFISEDKGGEIITKIKDILWEANK